MKEQVQELVEKLFAPVVAVAPGLRNAPREIGAELRRLGTHGSIEIASGLWTGNAFVQYGPGQRIPSIGSPYGPSPEQASPESPSPESPSPGQSLPAGPSPESPSPEMPSHEQQAHERDGIER